MEERHEMIDIETLSTSKNAAVLSIAAINFNPHYEQGIDDIKRNQCFYQEISLKWQPDLWGRVIDGSTLGWWMQQSEEARAVLLDPNLARSSLSEALVNLSNYLSGGDLRMWARGPQFDLEVLQNAYLAVQKNNAVYGEPVHQLSHVPWQYNSGRDLRTILSLCPKELGEYPQGHGLIKHNALDDCIAQIFQCQQAVRFLNAV